MDSLPEKDVDGILERIEIHPRRCGGTPVIRGTRIPVAVILDQFASGETRESILRGYPELAPEDIQAVLLYAKAAIEHTEIVPVAPG
jgi:uncharacterized protein (DUF433 family)